MKIILHPVKSKNISDNQYLKTTVIPFFYRMFAKHLQNRFLPLPFCMSLKSQFFFQSSFSAARFKLYFIMIK